MSSPSAASSIPEPVVTVSQDQDIVTAIKRLDVPADQQAETIDIRSPFSLGGFWDYAQKCLS